MIKKSFLLILLCTLLQLSLFAYSIYDLNLGSDISVHDARVGALGGSGVAGGFTLFDSSINPANLYFLNETKSIQLSYSLIVNSESRALPMWNFFDSFIGHSTYARNESYFNEFSVAGYWGFKFNDIALNIGASHRPVLNFGANYREEVRNDSDSNSNKFPPILALNTIYSKGLLNSNNLILNFGMPVSNVNVSLATEISFYSGTHDYEKNINWTTVAQELAVNVILDDFSEETKNEIEGMGFKFGLVSDISPRVRLGVSYSPKTELETTFSENGKVKEDSLDFILPSKLRFGFLFRPRNPLRTNFHVDLERINYSEINDFFEDGYAIHVGMEHYVGYAMPFRLGFSHTTAKQDKSLSLPVISAGTGFNIVDNIRFDISAEYGKREYTGIDLFPDSFYNKPNLWSSIEPKDRGWDNPDVITESFLKFFTSISYKF